ncbi:MAG: endonuclease/exonuclease/phosphatase family protein [Alphaproteobacteria bacterium]|nr:endonuclease/exonuclease/phosphatase family protein [Alphaproteobacteria bacterium]
MRLICFNISIKKDNTSGVIDLLNNLTPDFVALQESMMPHEKSVFAKFRSGEDVSNYFFRQMPYSFFAPLYIANSVTNNGVVVENFGGKVEQGTQVLSRYPICSAENKFYYENYKVGYDATHFKEKDWARSILIAIISLPNNKKVKIVDVHGIWNLTRLGDARTVAQSEFIITELLKDKMPTIVAGDFNLLPESQSIKILEQYLTNLSVKYKLKTTRPRSDDKKYMIVDYIFVTDDIKVKNFMTINTDVSDHLPLVLDFDIGVQK